MDTVDGRQFSPSAARNREPILGVLAQVLPRTGLMLEIASGTGEHVVHFAAGLPYLDFQPTDPDPLAIRSIVAWRAASGLQNIRTPQIFDVCAGTCPLAAADAVLCINMIHIAPPEATGALFMHASRLLASGAPMVLYGPFRRAGVATAASNEEFDASLKERNPAWGLRHLERVVQIADAHSFSAPEIIEMPANNLCVIFRKA